MSDPISVAHSLASLHTGRLLGAQRAPHIPMQAQLLIHHQFGWCLVFSSGETEAGQPLTPKVPECSRQGKVPIRKGIPEWLSAAIPRLSPSEIQQNAILSTWASRSVQDGSAARPTSSQLPVAPRAAAVCHPLPTRQADCSWRHHCCSGMCFVLSIHIANPPVWGRGGSDLRVM